jgi:hypothetical protein
VALNCKPLSKKGIFKIIKTKKKVLTNYIIKFRSGGGFLLQTRRLALDARKRAGAQRERIPDREIWRPRSSGGCTRHLPQRAVTLTTIIYWLGDLTIPIWEVTAEVTALSTRAAVTGNMLYVFAPTFNSAFLIGSLVLHLYHTADRGGYNMYTYVLSFSIFKILK